MRAFIINKPRDAGLIELPKPVPAPGELLIRVKACGVCGTDLHIYEGEFPVPLPRVPGHEFSGEVVEVGEGVKDFSEGDRVAVDPNIHCDSCYYCRRGRFNYCVNWQGIGLNRHGAYAEYVTVPVKNVYRVPDGLSYEAAAFMEPLACCIHGVDRVRAAPGENVAIFGLGPIGLLHVQLARLSGASKIIGIDLVDERLSMAEKLGADLTVNAAKEDPVKAIKQATRGHGVDVVVEASGSLKAFSQAIKVLDNTGRMLVFGVAPEGAKVEVEPFEIYRREISIVGSFTNPLTNERALKLLASGAVKVSPLITHKVGLKDVLTVFQAMKARDKKLLKALVIP